MFCVGLSPRLAQLLNDVTIASVAPGGWVWSLVTTSHTRHATNGGERENPFSYKLVSHALLFQLI